MRRLVPALLALLILLPAQAARAASTEVGIADDRILMAGGPAADQAVAEWRALGVDSVRIFALWSRIAPATRPAGFDGADPASPGYAWGPLDAAVARVRAAGMRVTLTITGPGPLWTSSSPSRRRPAYRPRPSAYAAFATAVALRYGADVDRYVLWNEPNIAIWLYPQARCSRGRCTPVSPHLYRGLVRAAYPAVRAADPGAQVVIGALSPRGQRLRRANTVMRPLAVPARLRLPQRSLDAAAHERVPELPPGDRRRLRDPSLRRPHRARARAPERRRRLARAGRPPHARRSTACSGRARCTRRRAASASTSTSTATSRTRPTSSPASGRARRTRGSSAPPTWPGATRGSGCSRSTCGATSRAAATAPTAAGSPACGTSAGARSPRSRTSTRRSCSTPARSRLWGQVRPGGRHSVTVEQRASPRAPWRRLAAVTTDAARLLDAHPPARAGHRRTASAAAGATSATLVR